MIPKKTIGGFMGFLGIGKVFFFVFCDVGF